MTPHEMASLPPGALGLAILIATEEQSHAIGLDEVRTNPRAYWLKLATECAQALGGRPSDNP